MPAYDASAEKMSSTDESRPGEQHNSGSKIITNPFEEVKPRISEYTAQEIATLQSRLEKQLGPEYISSRSGPSGQKVHYIAAEKCIQLANEVFGFNGWSSQIMDVQVDFVDENPQTLKVSLGLSVIVRVTLRDGTFHEDVGYGHMENSKGKAAAFEKAKKEGATDALKRALRNFGNVLGNCLYDKEYLKQVTKVKAQPARWNVDNLHRHSTFEPVKREMPSKPPGQEEKPQKEVGPPSLRTSPFPCLSGPADIIKPVRILSKTSLEILMKQTLVLQIQIHIRMKLCSKSHLWHRQGILVAFEMVALRMEATKTRTEPQAIAHNLFLRMQYNLKPVVTTSHHNHRLQIVGLREPAMEPRRRCVRHRTQDQCQLLHSILELANV